MAVNWNTPCANCIFYRTELITKEHGEEMWNCYCEDGNDEVLGSKYGCWHYIAGIMKRWRGDKNE